MQSWLDKISYGDRNISAGIDVFWLPEPGRKTLLISPDEQVQMLARLLTGKLPFSDSSKAVLRKIMRVKETAQGTLYGKTGTGEMKDGKSNLAWFVGFVESHGHAFAFACTLKGPHLMGKDARAVVESVLTQQGVL
jgi:beta-lactamase class D